MSTRMAPIANSRPDWQPGHIPRLSYRNPIPPGETPLQRDSSNHTVPRKPNGTGLSIKEIREALPHEPTIATYQSPVTTSPVQAQKNKKSFLGGLFAKEPSMAALGQVTQQMMTQHGSISPTAIPQVSSQKMPDHVPKVNSKWDGVPEYVKMREKQEREGGKMGRRNSVRPVDLRLHSTEIDDESVLRRRNSNAASTADSWDSRSTGSRPVFQDDVSVRPPSIYSTSSSESGNPAPRHRSNTAQSYNIIASAKTPETSVYYLDDIRSPPAPQRFESSYSTSTQSSTSSGQRRAERSLKTIPSKDTVPDYTSSSATTPMERSPKTPLPSSDDETRLAALLRGQPMLPAPINTIKSSHQAVRSREHGIKIADTVRKGSRSGASPATNKTVTPWETQVVPSEIARGTKGTATLNSSSKGRIFIRDKK